jgi:hypothetical protein
MKRRTFFKAIAGAFAGAAVGKLPALPSPATTVPAAGLMTRNHLRSLQIRKSICLVKVPEELLGDTVCDLKSFVAVQMSTQFDRGFL